MKQCLGSVLIKEMQIKMCNEVLPHPSQKCHLIETKKPANAGEDAPLAAM